VIVFPMAGRSRRFAEAGYQGPKYKLPVGRSNIFREVVRGFEAFYATEEFCFITQAADDVADFIKAECAVMGLRAPIVAALEHGTRGQAETVVLGLDQAGVGWDAPITIFNIDTIHKRYALPDDPAVRDADGYLEVFIGEGDGWSFVKSAPGSSRVLETTEKRRISDLCSTGLYYFKRYGDMADAFREAVQSGNVQAGEYYVAPLYNRLIEHGLDIRFNLIANDRIVFSGVPSEYEALLLNDHFSAQMQ